MAKYRKKPVVVEAMCVGRILDAQEIFDFVESYEHFHVDMETREFFIVTLEGMMKISPHDYIIKGVNGEFYPCKPDIFEKTYESVNKKNMDIQVSLTDTEIFNDLLEMQIEMILELENKQHAEKYADKLTDILDNRFPKIEFLKENME